MQPRVDFENPAHGFERRWLRGFGLGPISRFYSWDNMETGAGTPGKHPNRAPLAKYWHFGFSVQGEV